MPVGPDLGNFEELSDRVRRLALDQGRNQLAIPGISVIRSDCVIVKRKGWSPTLSVGVIVQGRKRVHVANQEHTYEPGHYLVVTGEGEFQSSVMQASQRHPYLSLSVQVDPALVAQQLIALSEAAPSVHPAPSQASAALPAYVSRLEPHTTNVLVRLLRTLDDPAEQRVLAPLALEELVFRLLQSPSAGVLRAVASRGDDQRRIQTALAFIRERATERLTVERIARHVAMSPSHFAHRFRDIVRVSPMRYVKHVRLSRARLMMIHEGARPAEAAAAVGYASTSHFTRDFRRYFEAPPAEYAQRFRAEVPPPLPLRAAED